MLTAEDIGATIRDTLGSFAEAATYRVNSTFTVRAAALTPAGSTTITFGNLPAGFTGALAGDTFVVGAGTYTVAAPVTPSGGFVTVTFAPALAVQVASATQVVLSRATDYPVRVLMEQVDGYMIQVGLYAGGDYRFTVFGLPIEPSGSGAHKVVWRGKTLSVQAEISRDSTGAAWIVRAK